MSQFFRKGGIALNDTEWIQDFADRRLQYGVSQTKLAVMAGISREHLSRIESGKVAVTEEMKVKLLEALEKFNPEAPLTMLFDYVRIRFPTLDIGHIIKDILQLNIQYMIHEDFGHYSYTEHYYIGDIFVYTSPDEEKGVLLELKGKGCRQFESYLLAQERSWYDFLMDALVDGGVMKRLDCQHFFRQIFLGYFSDIVQAFDTLRKNVCGDDYTSLHNPIVLSSVLPAYGMFHSIQILFL